jgi:hypothetical protein
MTDRRDEERLNFLARGLVAAERLDPRTKAAWQQELRVEVDRRGGVDPKTFGLNKRITNALLRELTQRGMRHVHNELVKRLTPMLSEAALEKLDADAADTLAAALARIRD